MITFGNEYFDRNIEKRMLEKDCMVRITFLVENCDRKSVRRIL